MLISPSIHYNLSQNEHHSDNQYTILRESLQQRYKGQHLNLGSALLEAEHRLACQNLD